MKTLPWGSADEKLGWRCRGGDVAQLAEHRIDSPLTQVRFPGAARDFFSKSHLSVQALERCPYTPVCNRMHLHLCARYRFCNPSQNSVDYRTTKTPSMHRRLGRATFPSDGNPINPWEKFHWDNTVINRCVFFVLKKKKLRLRPARWEARDIKDFPLEV